jgi:deoxyadenosine/deoxycytidine kinase
MQFFHRYKAAPLLIVNAAAIDPVHNDADFRQLLERILNAGSGREYFNPAPSLSG